ncbi:deoxyribose-phosphate aldolase [Pseudidiomarina sp.]|uniref:deoxyribose-phosphate aldolase n=1 Tax=Pseudidiomarina sp. TaxID=2081707 RepID=UPI00299F2769|nr:deoxyribose-phosphate aldolase [Pseudidiomarina sp.]MDX1706234.1 deoxyribose-phosphate aldolase [Pseudidiomarina sp.]
MELKQAARSALAMMDLTSLSTTDNRQTISDLCNQAHSEFGAPAALCVYPEWVIWARQELDRLGLAEVRIATVTNFPDGSSQIQRAVAETERAVAAGADEVDVVFPWQALLAGDRNAGAELVRLCKRACGEQAQLKVIIESGELQSPAHIRAASEIAIGAGADFIKTSTGKVSVNATPEAAAVMLNAIKESGRQCGFKAAGGVKTAADARIYLQLASDIMGSDWVTPEHFRFGASSLLTNLIALLSGREDSIQKGY